MFIAEEVWKIFSFSAFVDFFNRLIAGDGSSLIENPEECRLTPFWPGVEGVESLDIDITSRVSVA